MNPESQTANASNLDRNWLPVWIPVLAGAMAGGLGWGIRGQYGHQTGAMIAGVLVGLVYVHLFCPRATFLLAARAVAFCAAGISIGGAETYGQTVGLTHDPQFVGNWEAWRWGMLGLSIKGAIWIGFAATFLGMALSGVRYRVLDWAIVCAIMWLLLYPGLQFFNQPFQPKEHVLPKLYFSGDWHWQPNNLDLKPRREVWGGLLLSLAGAIAYAGVIRRDRLAVNLAFWGLLGGAIGFPLGQCVQSFHAWNKPLFAEGWLHQADAVINWWNMMETTFGATFGGILGFGIWRNRRRISDLAEGYIAFRPAIEWLLVAVYVAILYLWQFPPNLRGQSPNLLRAMYYLNTLSSVSIPLMVIPLIGIAGGRYWPFLFSLPMVMMPIAGKTLRNLCYEASATWQPTIGWPVLVGLPMFVTIALALWFATRPDYSNAGRRFTRAGLLWMTWIFHWLNFAFFLFPWPWTKWTARTPNEIIYFVFAIGLTLTAVAFGGRREPGAAELMIED